MANDKNHAVIVYFVDEKNELVTQGISIPWEVEWAVPNYEAEIAKQKDAVIATALFEVVKSHGHYKAQQLLKQLLAGTVGAVFYVDSSKVWTSPTSNFPLISLTNRSPSDN